MRRLFNVKFLIGVAVGWLVLPMLVRWFQNRQGTVTQ